LPPHDHADEVHVQARPTERDLPAVRITEGGASRGDILEFPSGLRREGNGGYQAEPIGMLKGRPFIATEQVEKRPAGRDALRPDRGCDQFAGAPQQPGARWIAYSRETSECCRDVFGMRRGQISP
jgi:hypothetical protein